MKVISLDWKMEAKKLQDNKTELKSSWTKKATKVNRKSKNPHNCPDLVKTCKVYALHSCQGVPFQLQWIVLI
jgi:hypothetical protein